jgi:hypothetical protein
MKTELRRARHTAGTGYVVEVFFAGRLIATLYPADDGPGVKLITKHRVKLKDADDAAGITVMTMQITERES